ncbi:MAG: Nif3-like dinuclear metal center hexameric protein [Faecousia sp.]
MTTVSDILKYIETSVAPSYMKEDWDHVGLNCGHPDAPVTKVLVALDPFDEAIREAIAMGAELLVTHHALIWRPDFVTDADSQGRRTLELIEHHIAHINAHTNLDCAPGGVNDVLASVLGLSDVSVINPSGVDEQGREWGLLRCGTVPEQPLENFLATVKTSLSCGGLRYVNSNSTVRRVAVGGGSCAGAMPDAVRAGCDTFVTADVKYNQFRDAHDLGLNLIDAGHFHTERPVCAALAGKIAAAFPEVTVKISETHRDCMKYY